MRLEHTDVRTHSADLQMPLSVAALLSDATEAEVVWRADTQYAARLRPCIAIVASKRDGALMPGVYAITGGLGGLGLRTAALLVDRDAAGIAEPAIKEPPGGTVSVND